MGFDVGRVTIEYLPRPRGRAYKLVQELAAEAACHGEGNAFGFYQGDELEDTARDFAGGDPSAEAEILQWVRSLPWDEQGYLVLTFNW